MFFDIIEETNELIKDRDCVLVKNERYKHALIEVNSEVENDLRLVEIRREFFNMAYP